MKLLSTALALAALLVAAGNAAAQQSQHERAKATSIVENGQVVGLRLALTLRPNESARNVVRVGLGPITATGWLGDNRDKASMKSKGYLVHQWDEIKFDANEIGKPKPITLDVKFADAPKLKPGAKVEVITAWNNKSHSLYWHIWGLQITASDKTSVVTVPKLAATPKAKKPAAMPAAAATATATTTPKKPRARAMATAMAAAPATAATAMTTPKKPRAARTPKK
jgi:hypothetical protein